jgi:hypothetical protein
MKNPFSGNGINIGTHRRGIPWLGRSPERINSCVHPQIPLRGHKFTQRTLFKHSPPTRCGGPVTTTASRMLEVVIYLDGGSITPLA